MSVFGLVIDAARAEVAWQKVTGGGFAGRVEIRQGDANQLEEKKRRLWYNMTYPRGDARSSPASS